MWHHSRKIFWNLIQARQVTVGNWGVPPELGAGTGLAACLPWSCHLVPHWWCIQGVSAVFSCDLRVVSEPPMLTKLNFITFLSYFQKSLPSSQWEKKSDRQTPSQWIYWTLEHPFLQGKPIVFFSFWIPLGVIYREKCVSFRSCRVLTRYWHGDYLCLCHPFYPNPTCHSLCPLRRNHWMGRMCSWCLLLKFRMNFLLSLVARCH